MRDFGFWSLNFTKGQIFKMLYPILTLIQIFFFLFEKIWATDSLRVFFYSTIKLYQNIYCKLLIVDEIFVVLNQSENVYITQFAFSMKNLCQ